MSDFKDFGDIEYSVCICGHPEAFHEFKLKGFIRYKVEFTYCKRCKCPHYEHGKDLTVREYAKLVKNGEIRF